MSDRIYRHLLFFAPALVLSAWAIVLAQVYFSGHITHLLAAPFRPYVLLAASLLFLLSVAHVWFYQPPQAPLNLSSWHRFRQTARWLALLLPVLAAAFLSPRAFSNTTLANRTLDSAPNSSSLAMPVYATATEQNLAQAAAADPNQPAPMEITDLITIAANPKKIQVFEGRTVRVTGIYAPQTIGGVRLLRWMMWCCAADMQPITVAMTDATPFSEVTNDPDHPAWVEAIGTLHYVNNQGKTVPQLIVKSLKSVNEPDDPYLSP